MAGHILVSDDDTPARESIASVLARAGFSCDTADSSAKALALVEEKEFDLVIADIHMAGNADLEMVRALNEQRDSPPVILVTGQPSLETAMKAVRLRVFDYLLKPVDGEKLIAHAREGVATGRMMKILRSHRSRIEKSLAEIDRCENLSRNGVGTTLNTALSTYLRLAVQQSLTTIIDVGDLAALVVSRNDTEDAERRLHAARPLVLVNALHETIRVLERTKMSFKSRELADLRKKLEDLMA